MTFLSKDQVRALGFDYSDKTFDRLAASGQFPKPVMLSPRRKMFVEAEVKEHAAKLAANRDA